MRGCLFVVVLGAVVLGVAIWFGGPAIAAVAVRSSLAAAGVETDEPAAIEVELGSPVALLGGRAEAVRVVMGPGGTPALRWSAARIELGQVDLLARRPETVELALHEPVLVDDAAGDLAAERLEASGPADTAATRIVLRLDQVEPRLRAALEGLGPLPADLALTAPNILSGGGGAFRARLLVVDGRLVLDPEAGPLPEIELFEPPSDLPFRLETATVSDGRLVLAGTLDLAAWLG